VVKVERIFAGDGAVEARLEERREAVLLPPAPVVVPANPRHATEHGLPAVPVLHRRLPEEEQGHVAITRRGHKGRTCARKKEKEDQLCWIVD